MWIMRYPVKRSAGLVVVIFIVTSRGLCDVSSREKSRALSSPMFPYLPFWASARSGQVKNSSQAHRAARFFSVIQLIRFKNKACASSEPAVNGTCYRHDECVTAGGRPAGSCAEGFGVCCLFSLGCGEISSKNNTNFRGPGNLTAPFNCRLSVEKMSESVCQLRLDFDRLRLAGPGADGVCRQDQLTVIGAASAQPPVLCGHNDGHHMYIDVSPGSGSQVTIQVTTSGSGDAKRTWDIRISQLECTSPAKAPSACLQYHTNTTGMIKSFSFDTNENGAHLAGQRYAICLRTNAGFCGVQYTSCTESNSFTVSETIGASKSGACSEDYVTVVGVSADGLTGEMLDRHCGSEWSGERARLVPGVTYSRPFVVYVSFDDTETAIEQEGPNRGFCLHYMQLPCTSVTNSVGANGPRRQLVTYGQTSSNPVQPLLVSGQVLSVGNPSVPPLRRPTYSRLSTSTQRLRPSTPDSGVQQQNLAAPGWDERNNYYFG